MTLKEQIMKYEKLKLEAFPQKKKIRLLQNAVGEVTELLYIKQIEHMVNKAKLQRHRHTPFWKFSVLVTQTHEQDNELDKQNNNPTWQEVKATKMGKLLVYKTFVGKGIVGNLPSGYKRICCHMLYDVKHDGRHKS
jgi:hypothetical protein